MFNMKGLPGMGKPSGIAGTTKQLLPTHMADGGVPSGAEMAPWYSRSEARGMDHSAGLFPGATGGRTDNMNLNVPAGSHVIPADVVSGLGEGNTMAGAAVLDRMFHTGPGGMHLNSGHAHPSFPRAPAPMKFADGGKVGIVGAAGEYLVHPSVVKRLGNGDQKHGHNILDKFIVHVRKKTAKKMLRLPGPKK
jgi:hypothetical protein